MLALYRQLFDEAYNEADIDLVLIETLRDMARQVHYINIGVSWTMNSMHLPQPPNGKALAFDVAPEIYLDMKGWNPSGEHWDTVGAMGKALGLDWGGDYVKTPDRPHFFLTKCICPAPTPEILKA